MNNVFRTKYWLIVVILITTITACAQKNKINKNNTTMNFEITKTNEDWKKTLTEEQYYVLREKGTEKPYSGKFLLHKEKGNYTCAACGNILFSSDSKFDSHCGWPSFDKQIGEKNITIKEDNSLGMQRTEILCGKCGGHLGHIFNDGPTETGMRYCVNSLSLSFEEDAKNTANTDNPTTQIITLGGGCFWCIEAIFKQLKGVQKVESGYAGGNKETVTYEEVCTGKTGFAEVIQITFDTNEIDLTQILKVFFTVHNPTTLNQQGADKGTQYRSAIFYRNEEQKILASKIIQELTAEKVYDNAIVTTIEKMDNFIVAEDYHQNYYTNNKSQSYCQFVIQPKLEKFEKVFKNLLKK